MAVMSKAPLDKKTPLKKDPQRAWFDQAPVGVCVVKKDRRHDFTVLYSNKALQALMGKTAAGLLGH
ncbi:MAG TPA: hypothetical protein VGD95_00235, partial [Micavibrio sp.]